MTIGHATSISRADYPTFAFGIPLEDVFPEDRIHPYLDELLQITLKIINQSDYPISVILTTLKGALNHRLALKDAVIKGYNIMEAAKEEPGIPFWILRHFLGLLPIQLLPPYTDGTYFNWKDISVACKRFIVNKIECSDSRHFVYRCAREISKLPNAHILLLHKLIKFFRRIILCPLYSGEHLRKTTALSLIRFFTSSIFVRPFLPGNNGEAEKIFQPLLLYFITKWPLLDKYSCKYRLEKYTQLLRKIPEHSDTESSLFSQPENIEKQEELKNHNNFNTIPEIIAEEEEERATTPEDTEQEQEPKNADFVEKERSNDKLIKTDFESADDKIKRREEEKEDTPAMLRLVPYIYYYDTDKYLKDISCQTDQTFFIDNFTQIEKKFLTSNFDDLNNNDGFYKKFEDPSSSFCFNNQTMQQQQQQTQPQIKRQELNTNYISNNRNREKVMNMNYLDEDDVFADYKQKELKRGVYGWVYSIPSNASDTDHSLNLPNNDKMQFQDNDSNNNYNYNYKLLGSDRNSDSEDFYIFDEYDNFQFDESKSNQNLISEKSKNTSSSIMNKVLKIGWTYSPTSNKEKDKDKPTVRVTKKFGGGQVTDSYKLYFSSEKNLCENCNSATAIVGNCPSENKTKKRRSLINFAASKIDLRRLFTPSKNKGGDDVKYNKIESTKSSFF